jgi:hypothetical protein
MKRLFIVTVIILGLTAYYSFGKDSNDPVDKQKLNLDSSTQKSDSDTSCPLNSADLAAAQAFIKFKKLKASFMPSGIPDVYGQELNISFNQVQDAINKVRIFGPTYGKEGKKITLTGNDLKRYTSIGTQIACEYCCRAKTMVKPDGVAACGCAHSIMMRGLTAYLIKNHPEEFSDEEILKELNKWKITYFPKQTLSAKLVEMEKSGDEGIREILKEFPEFLPKMVGGC